VSEPWQLIAEAWTPHLGPQIAEERARNAAMCLRGHDVMTEEVTADVLTRSIMMARLPTYGGVKLSGSTIIDAVNAATEALAYRAASSCNR
jgi:hypothetical protein